MTLDVWDDSTQRWIVEHADLLEAVVLLGDMLGVDWEDGQVTNAPDGRYRSVLKRRVVGGSALVMKHGCLE